MIVLKIRGYDDLIYLNVDDLKAHKKKHRTQGVRVRFEAEYCYSSPAY